MTGRSLGGAVLMAFERRRFFLSQWNLKMKMIFAAAAFAVACFISAPAHAVDGNFLRTACRTGSPFCSGYLLGAAEQLQAINDTVCIANGTTGEQFRAVFLRWIESRPQIWNRNAQILVEAAFEQAWPCADTGKKAASR